MDHMEFSIALPPLVELSNAGIEWNTMKQRLYTHLNPNASSNPYRNFGLQQPFLISIATEQVQGIFNMYDVSYDEATKFSKILQNIEDLCLPRFLIIYNRFRFFTCKQNGPEFNGFLQQLLAWSDLCEFGDLKDILLKDCIISGISEESVRQHLLRTEQLDFDKTVDICRAVLAKKQSAEDFKSANKILVNVSTNTSMEDEYIGLVNSNQNVEKFNVAVNTNCLELDEKSVQTVMAEYNVQVQPMERDILMTDIHELKPLNLDDEYDQITSGMNFPHHNETIMCHGSTPPHQMSVPEYNEHAQSAMTMTECLPLPSINDDFVQDCHETEMPVLRRSPTPRNYKPSVMMRQTGLICAAADTESETNDELREDILYQNHDHIAGILNSGDPLSYDKSDDNQTQSTADKCDDSQTQSTARLKCRACKASFNDLLSLQIHKKTHEEEKKYKCDVCPSKFYNASHLKVHKRLHTGERPYVCDTCSETFVEASKLKAHVRKHTGERPYECTECGMTFTWSAAFSRHKRIHTGERPYVCQYCGSKFADFTSLQRHTRTHTKDKPYKCAICNHTFADPSALRAHKRVHTGERHHHCKLCGASFTRAQHVKEHMKLHLGEKPFKCEICCAAFVEASKLKSHMRRHTGEKPYQCKVCDASFAWTAAYTRHMRTHTFEKPYLCKVCGSTFADNSTLIRHHRTHTGERPYHCTQCTFSFADSSSLNRHQRIHSGEKAFTCEICGASFAVKSYLSRHIRIHTGERPYGCDICTAKFSDSSKLKRHQKIHERDKPKEDKQLPHHVMTSMPPPLEYPTLNLRHEMPHFQDDEILTHLSKPCSLTFDHPSKSDHQFDPMHGHDSDIANGLALSFVHAHDENMDLATSVSASFGITQGIDSLANILSFDS